MKKLELLLLGGIILLAFFVRLYRFSEPLADWHSWRQVDTSAVSREFVTNGFDLLHPKFQDISNVPSGKDNPEGHRFVEFPLYNAAQAGLFLLFGYFNLEQWGRLVTIFSSLLTIIFLFLFVKKYTDATVAFYTSLFFALIPYNIYYGRTVLPDTSMAMAILGGIYFFDKWLEKRIEKKNSKNKTGVVQEYVFYILAIIFTQAAFLLKPYALFFTLPMLVLAYQAFGLKMFTNKHLWLFGVLTLIPLISWRWWMMQYPEGIPRSDWLFNGNNIRFKPSFFYWIFANRLGKLILGYWGMSFFILGLLINSKSESQFHFRKGQRVLFLSFLASSLLYVTVIATGNVQHDYYQILTIPSITIFLGLGAKFFLNPPQGYINKYVSILLFAISLVLMISFRWYTLRTYFNINNRAIVQAGQEIDKKIPKDAKVIALYNGDTTFLYYTNRKGWASLQDSVEGLKEKGADYLAIPNPSEKDAEIGMKYKIISHTPDYILFDLNQGP